jgi:hypothetical protein
MSNMLANDGSPSPGIGDQLSDAQLTNLRDKIVFPAVTDLSRGRFQPPEVMPGDRFNFTLRVADVETLESAVFSLDAQCDIAEYGEEDVGLEPYRSLCVVDITRRVARPDLTPVAVGIARHWANEIAHKIASDTPDLGDADVYDFSDTQLWQQSVYTIDSDAHNFYRTLHMFELVDEEGEDVWQGLGRTEADLFQLMGASASSVLGELDREHFTSFTNYDFEQTLQCLGALGIQHNWTLNTINS